MIVINEILVVGVGMHGLDVPCANAVFVICGLQNRHDGVGRTGRRRQNRVVRSNVVIIDARNNVFDVAFTRRRENNFGHPFRLKMPRQSCLIPPHAGVINHHAIVDAVCGVIDVFRRVSVNDFDLITIGDKALALLIDPDRAVKCAVYGITPEQTGSLHQVVLSLALTDNHRA